MNQSIRELSFEAVGGLEEHIRTIKEMIIYPLLYGEVFDSYGIQAPRGILFYGPPGTGKTLMAGAVAAECSRSCARKVAFYMRKGGDCLNKYVGESEKHIQNLFKQAHNTRPSIIFFDEIDGLVPTRSEMQEQVHASVVATLLALMDGLDSKSEVFVIGATNRIDMIDSALRRPGRFDRELYFPLPSLEARLEIFKIHTKNWTKKPNEELLLKLAAECSGYCGADIQSLCSQAVMMSFSRSFPEVVDTSKKQDISVKSIHVRDDDFWEAKNKVVPAIERVSSLPSSPLSSELEPLLKRTLNESLDLIYRLCPFFFMDNKGLEFTKRKSLSCPRFLLMGKVGQAHISHIAPAILHHFDHLPVVVLDLSTIYELGNQSSDSSSFVHKIEEARQSMPSIIYLRNVAAWWDLIDEPAKQVLISSLEGLDTCNNSKIFIFGTASVNSYDQLHPQIKQMFPKKKSFEMKEPNIEEKKNFFWQVIVDKNVSPFNKVEASCNSELKFSLRSKKAKKPSPTTSTGKLRNGKRYRKSFSDKDVPSPKKSRVLISYSPHSSSRSLRNASNVEIKIDIEKLEELVDSAVKVSSKARVGALIRFYEELEIISLKYASKLDRTELTQDLEHEISIFHPS